MTQKDTLSHFFDFAAEAAFDGCVCGVATCVRPRAVLLRNTVVLGRSAGYTGREAGTRRKTAMGVVGTPPTAGDGRHRTRVMGEL